MTITKMTVITGMTVAITIVAGVRLFKNKVNYMVYDNFLTSWVSWGYKS